MLKMNQVHKKFMANTLKNIFIKTYSSEAEEKDLRGKFFYTLTDI